MGSAQGFGSTVVLRAESPAHAGDFRQSKSFWGGLSVLNRSVGSVSLGPAQCWYIGGPLALKRNGALGSKQTALGGTPIARHYGTELNSPEESAWLRAGVKYPHGRQGNGFRIDA